MSLVFSNSYTPTNPHRGESKALARTLYLETQPSAEDTCSDPGKQANHHQCRSIQTDQRKYANIICTRGGTKTTQSPIKKQVGRDGGGTRLSNAGGPGPTTHIPPEIAVTSHRPDLDLWSTTQHRVYCVELTIAWEDTAQEAFQREKLRHSKWKLDVRALSQHL